MAKRGGLKILYRLMITLRVRIPPLLPLFIRCGFESHHPYHIEVILVKLKYDDSIIDTIIDRLFVPKFTLVRHNIDKVIHVDADDIHHMYMNLSKDVHRHTATLREYIIHELRNRGFVVTVYCSHAMRPELTYRIELPND